MRAAALLVLLAASAWALPFSLSDDDRLFGSRWLLLENPGLLSGAGGRELFFSLEGGSGPVPWVRGYAFGAVRDGALGAGLGWPAWGFAYAALSQEGYGLAGYYYPSGNFGLALGYAGTAEVWGWLEGGRGTPNLRAYHRRVWGRVRSLVVLEWTPGVRGRLLGYLGRARRRGREELRWWGGLALGRDPGVTGLELRAGGRWLSPVMDGPVVVDLRATTRLSLAFSDRAGTSLTLVPLALRTDWRWRQGPLELRLRFPFLRVYRAESGLAVELRAGAFGRLALR